MRKWKCVKLDNNRGSNSIRWTLDKIYETDDEGEGLVSDNRDVGFINVKDFRYETSGCEFEEINNEIKPINSIQKKIVITISNSTITLSDDIHNILISRYYNDKKDEEVFVGEIIDKYFNELKKINKKHILKVGDTVKVINEDSLYSSYQEWLINNNVPLASAIKWSYGKNIDTKCEYKIIAIHKHSENDIEKLALIENYYNSFIISLEGLEKV